MNKNDTDFDTWFNCLVMNLADAGINFRDEDSVRKQYDDGDCMYDVLDEIKQEYNT